MISFEPQKPRPDLYSQTKALYHSGEGGVDLSLINKAELIAATILVFTLSAAIAQQHYYPLGPIFQQGVTMTALIPLPFVLLLEGVRQQGEILNEISGFR